MYVTAYNPTNAPLTADAAGRQIGGGEWGTVDTTAEGVRADLLVIYRNGIDEAKETSKEALAAVARTQEITERASQLDELDRVRLADLARTEGILTDEDEVPTKTQLVSLLAGQPKLDPPVENEPDDTQQTAKARQKARGTAGQEA